MFMDVIRKSGHKQALSQFFHPGDLDFLAVQGSAFSLSRKKKLVINGTIHPSSHDLTRNLYRDRNAEHLKTVCEIGRAVERIDNPSSRSAFPFDRTFFRENAVFRKTLSNLILY